MRIVARTDAELQRMRDAGRIVAATLARVREMLSPGLSTKAIDEAIRDYVLSQNGSLLFLNYKGFPAHACISINEEVVHGIPRARRKLQQGDIVKVDVGVKYRGYCGDSAWTFAVGDVSPLANRMLEVGETALQLGIAACRPGSRVSDIGRAIQGYVEGQGFHVVRKYVGHGIGTKLHEAPQVPNFVDVGLLRQDPLLHPGYALAIEPMVNQGTPDTEELDDGWTVVTKDRGLSVHFEHTVAIRDGDPWILTSPDGP
jgi:methionyl aminopeptidase